MSNDELLDSLDWTRIDEDWNGRWDAQKLSSIERELDEALWKRGESAGFELQWRWARLSHFRAMQVLEAISTGQRDKKSGGEEALRHMEAGAKEAESALKLEHNRVEGFFWAGCCALEAARLKNPIQGARALAPAEKRIEKAVAVDETYHFAGPLRVWGRLTHLKPFVLGGNLNHALEIYRRAIQVAPDNSTTLLYHAQALIADRQPGLARQTLQKILAAPEDAAWKWEQARDKRIAREELEKL